MRIPFPPGLLSRNLNRSRLLKRNNRRFLGVERLEPRDVPAAILSIQNAPTGVFPQFALVDPNPDAGGTFGMHALFLSTGNIVVTDPLDDAGGADAGAVYLFNGTTGALISTLKGSSANDKVGNDGVTAVGNGNYVVRSEFWDNGAILNAGAATWGSGITGISGTVSAANSLVGSSNDDGEGGVGITVLSNGNYVVRNLQWNDFRGAVTWGRRPLGPPEGPSAPLMESRAPVRQTAAE